MSGNRGRNRLQFIRQQVAVIGGNDSGIPSGGGFYDTVNYQYYISDTGSHAPHGVAGIGGTDPQANLASDTCTVCHLATTTSFGANHADDNVNMRIGSIGTRVGGTTYADNGTYDNLSRSCSSTYCHAGQTTPLGGGGKFNTDAPGEHVQDDGRLMAKAVRAPQHDLYLQEWDIEVPASLTQSLTEPGRPATHLEYVKAWDYYLGRIEPDPERWLRLNNFYLNCIRAVDLQIKSVLDELEDLGLTDSTIVVFTSDHGEMGGAHGGMRGKGPTPYEECIHLPFVIAHPDVSGGQDCQGLTSHTDIAPTLARTASGS